MELSTYENMYTIEKYHWWYVHRRKIIQLILDKFCKLNSSSKICDMGCGTGGNLESLIKKYPNYVGVDCCISAIEFCKKRNLNNVYLSKIPNDIKIENNSVDLILLLDVLEHIDNDDKTIKILSDKLKFNGGGYILLTVPAFNFLWSNHDVVHHHKRRYRLREIENLLKKYNFEIIKWSYFFSLTFIPLVLTRLLKKKINKISKIDDTKINNKLLNKFWLKLLSLELFLLKFINIPIGSSIIILAKKSEEKYE